MFDLMEIAHNLTGQDKQIQNKADKRDDTVVPAEKKTNTTTVKNGRTRGEKRPNLFSRDFWKNREPHKPRLAGIAGGIGSIATIAAATVGGGSNADTQEGLIVEPTASHVQKVESGVSQGSKNETSVAGLQSREKTNIRLDSTQIKSILNEVSINLKEDATKSIPLILKAFADEDIISPPVIGFGFANAEHEAWFDYAKKEIDGDAQAEKYGYAGGMPGMGLIQITGESNMRKYSKYLSERFPERYKGLDLVKNPEKALEPDISAAILAAFIKNEKNEKGESIADLVNQGRFEEARKKVVGNYSNTDLKNIEVTKNITKRSKEFEKAFLSDLYKTQIAAHQAKLLAQGRN